MITYQPYLNRLEKDAKEFIKKEEQEPKYLYNMIHYHMGWMDRDFHGSENLGGKRLRPLLLLLSCEAFCGQWHHAIPAAIAVELLHNFTLIHDDIEDRDEVRHGRPTVWFLWGIPQAINAGDALYALAYKALLSLPPAMVNSIQTVKAARVYTDAVLRITEGQCQDISFESLQTVSESDYMDMITGKTASLLGLSCELGAIIAGADDNSQRYITEFGIAMGMAFQMQDDILGLWGDPQNTGKPVGSDLYKAKKTLPIIHCTQHNTDFQQLIAKPITEAEIEKAMQLLEMTGSFGYTQNKAKQFFDKAQHALDIALLGSSHQSKIMPLVLSLIKRQR